MLQFTFEKNNLLCKKREKNNSLRGKIPELLKTGVTRKNGNNQKWSQQVRTK